VVDSGLYGLSKTIPKNKCQTNSDGFAVACYRGQIEDKYHISLLAQCKSSKFLYNECLHHKN